MALGLALNDAEIVGVGGSVTQIGGSSRVVMQSERVKLELPAGKVTTDFVFRNDGSAVKVQMGFPEEGYNSVPTKENPTFFEKFESWVDGRAAKVKAMNSDFSEDDMTYKIWWVKEVAFAKGQTRRVKNIYTAPLGGSAMGTNFFQYIVETGASWHGSIGDAVIEADISGLKPGTIFTATPAGFVRKGDRLIWHWPDFEPTPNMNIYVSWLRDDHPFEISKEDLPGVLGGPVMRR